MKTVTPSEIQLALRAPGAGWLAVLACVIDEASQDPDFDAHQRELAIALLDRGKVPAQVAAAAHQRAASFEAQLDNGIPEEACVSTRPILTLVGTDS